MGCGDDQAEFFEPGQALDNCGAREPGPLHELAEADRHAPIRKTVARLNDHQVNLDRLTADSRKVTPVEEHGLDPIGLDRYGHHDRHGV